MSDEDEKKARRSDLDEVAALVVKEGCRIGITYDSSPSSAEWWAENRTCDSSTLKNRTNTIYIDSSNWKIKPPDVMEIAQESFILASDKTKRGTENTQGLDHVFQKVWRRLNLVKGADLRGRRSADVALILALAGCNDDIIFGMLVDIAAKEVPRFGSRASCKPTQILHMIEKFAASGARGPKVDQLNKIAADILRRKGCDEIVMTNALSTSFFSDRPLTWLWRASTRQSKIKPAQSEIFESLKWESLFEDPTCPLVVDLGSGMGTSLLGLAAITGEECEGKEPIQLNSEKVKDKTIDIDWPACNFLGVELNPALAGFARGVAARWKLDNKLQFVSVPADVVMTQIPSYPGGVEMCSVQFPTPFRLQSNNDDPSCIVFEGNRQLPDETKGFMVTKDLISSVARSSKRLLLVSNSEDVAVHMRKVAEDGGLFTCVDVPYPVRNVDDIEGRVTWRTKRMNGPRAVGGGWSRVTLLPPISRSETETSKGDTPIHRCVLVVAKNMFD